MRCIWRFFGLKGIVRVCVGADGVGAMATPSSMSSKLIVSLEDACVRGGDGAGGEDAESVESEIVGGGNGCCRTS